MEGRTDADGKVGEEAASQEGDERKVWGIVPVCHYIHHLLLFTVTDGAVRMIVLLHAYNKGFTAMDVAIMFSFYELAGVLTNLVAGMLGARWGIKTTLLTGLTVQLVAFALVSVNYYLALGVLCGFILAAYPFALFGLSNELGRARKENVKFSQLFKNKYNINILSLSRVFLFGSRDLWFEVPLPFFLRNPESGIGWKLDTPTCPQAPQAITPRQVCCHLVVCLLVCADRHSGGLLLGSDVFGPNANSGSAISALTVLLYSFCIFFAINSAIHSYLIVRYADGDKVAMQVGVYYASNALGRLLGTLFSGVLYTYVGSTVVDGFGACVIASCLVSLVSTFIDNFLREDQVGATFFGPLKDASLAGFQHHKLCWILRQRE
eukprot:jgi/Picre1/28962/NNA_004356.t1